MDDDLLRRCQRGDATALTELIARHQDRLFRTACRVLRDPARAEDAVADAFATMWARCRSWRGEAAATWIGQVAYRVVLDHARARRRWWQVLSRPAPDLAADYDDEVADRDERAHAARRLDAALGTLTPDERALVHLHYYEGQSLAEIGAVLGVTRDALKMRLSRVRDRLRKALGELDESR